MNHLVALQSLRSATQAVGQMASKVGEATMQAANSAGSTFHELFSGSSDAIANSSGEAAESTEELRQQIADIAERVMKSIGLSLDQPLNLAAAEDGTLRVGANHPRAAEVEMSLSAEPGLSELVSKLIAKADSASRYFVLHRVDEGVGMPG